MCGVDSEEMLQKPAPKGNFIYGLFMEGARWDSGKMCVEESLPKKLFYSMPHIWLKPAVVVKKVDIMRRVVEKVLFLLNF